LKSQLAKAVLQELTPEKLKAHFDLSSTSMHQPEDDIVAQVNAMSLEAEEIFYNSSPAVLYQEALQEKGSAIVSSGALAVSSHAKTGRSPLDKRIVDEPSSTKDIWWGKVNIPLSSSSFMTNRERALDYLNTREKLYVIDGFVGWDPEFRLPVRVIASRAYHALFMQNMLVPPKKSELGLHQVDDFLAQLAGMTKEEEQQIKREQMLKPTKLRKIRTKTPRLRLQGEVIVCGRRARNRLKVTNI